MNLSLTTLVAFALTALFIELTPGPNMVYLAILTLGSGRRAGYVAVAGVAFGLLLLGMVAAFGLGVLILSSPAVYQVLRWVGVAYLLWLAWDCWHTRPSQLVAGISDRRHFLRGFITNMLNPKAGFFYVVLLPNFVDVTGSLVGQAITLSVVYVAIATIVHGLVVTLAGVALPFLQDPPRQQIIRRILSLALAIVALWLAWSTR